MQNPMRYCPCCGRTMPVASHWLTVQPICVDCAALRPATAALTARDTAAREHAAHTPLREQRRNLALLAYATQGKRCAECHRHMPTDQYARCSARTDCLQAVCRGCTKAQAATLALPGGKALWKQIRDAMRARAHTILPIVDVNQQKLLTSQ